MRTIQKIASPIAHHFVDIDEGDIDKSDVSISFDKTKLGLFSKYLNRLHDSKVLKADTVNGNFSLTLNDIVFHVYADALLERKRIEIAHEVLVFPICLEFEEADVTFHLFDESGLIHQIDQLIFDEYIDEQILKIKDGLIEIALVVWKNEVKGRRCEYILILIKTSGIKVTEFQEKGWESLFGTKYQRYYEHFRSQLKEDRYCADQTVCCHLIEEVDGNPE